MSALDAMIRRRDRCRLCDDGRLTTVLSLAPSPPANAFVSSSEVATVQPLFPLDVWMCETCSHVQLLDVVDPGELFSGYVYASGTSPVFVSHFADYVDDIYRRCDLKQGDLVVDIGSNDGTLLRFFKDRGQRVLGIDPALDIAQRATDSGIETIAGFFTPALAEEVLKEHGQAKVVTANNVFAHIDDLSSVVRGIRTLLSNDGLFAFEVSYLLDVVEKGLFDTIYHEHLDYHSVEPLVRFFGKHGLRLAEVARVDSHGGSLRGIVRLADAGGEDAPTVASLIEVERRAGLSDSDTFVALGAKIDRRGQELSHLLGTLRGEGKTIAGFGAPAKATTLMHHFGIGPDVIDFVVDDSPLKQGLFTPGFHLPVVPSSVMYERRPDYVLILAWNFAESILARHAQFVEQGGHFIVPLPELEVY